MSVETGSKQPLSFFPHLGHIKVGHAYPLAGCSWVGPAEWLPGWLRVKMLCPLFTYIWIIVSSQD